MLILPRPLGVDPPVADLYIFPMDIIDQIQDSKTDIGLLEKQVEQLILACSHLKDENDSLRMRQESLVAEKAELIEKTEIARTRVEAMISRLKSMENGL